MISRPPADDADDADDAAGSPPIRLTVAVPTFRRPTELTTLLADLIAQLDGLAADGAPAARPRLEPDVLVIDNDPAESGVAAAAQVVDPRVRVVAEPRPGLAAVRNRALDETHDRRLLVFVDDDERPSPGWLAALVATWARTGAAAVAGPVVSELPEVNRGWVEEGGFFDRRHRFRLSTGDELTAAATNNLLLDRDAVGGLRFDPRFGLSGGEDSLFTRQLHRTGARLVWCAEAVMTERVPEHRMDRGWLAARAVSNGNSEARVALALATSAARRALTHGRCVAGGALRVAGGVGRWLAPTADHPRARAVRTVGRGVGLLAGGLGFSYLEYRRGRRRWQWSPTSGSTSSEETGDGSPGPHVLFDGHWWVGGPQANRRVLRELILGWEREFRQDRLTVAVPGADLGRVRGELPGRVRLVATRVPQHGLGVLLELPLIAHRLRPDVTLTHNFTPLGPRNRSGTGHRGRRVVFVHDLMFETSPEWFTPAERRYFGLMTRTARSADLVATSSAAEARRIDTVARLAHPAVAIGMGSSRELLDAVAAPPAEPAGLERFVLIVGRLNVRKNLSVAIEGALASGKIGVDRPVVVVGEPNGRHARLEPAVRAAVDRGEVVFCGFVPDPVLHWLYTHAEVFLCLSRDEGFGLPVLEALELGTPSVLSDIPVFREVAGDRASYADPDDVAAIGAAVRAVSDRVERGWRPVPTPAEELGLGWSTAVRRLRAAILDDRADHG